MQPRSESVAEFTAKAVAAGVLLGIVFGAANAYLGLRVGMTVSASIPAAVMTVALFRLFRARGTILEANISQTIGSASTSLATGTIFTIPALFLWGMAPPYLQVVVLCFLGALLGLSAMIPLRRLLIVDAKDELPYPEGTACAEVLRATAEGSPGSAFIFRGMAIGAAVKLLVSLASSFRARSLRLSRSSRRRWWPSSLPPRSSRSGSSSATGSRRSSSRGRSCRPSP